jgi:hypothetical protein
MLVDKFNQLFVLHSSARYDHTFRTVPVRDTVTEKVTGDETDAFIRTDQRVSEPLSTVRYSVEYLGQYHVWLVADLPYLVESSILLDLQLLRKKSRI